MLRLIITLLFLIVFAFSATASEDCSKLGGKCGSACGANETAEAGAFEDCAEKDECCVPRSPGGQNAGCCVRSFDAANFGPQNCEPPRNGVCTRGSASPAPCEKLAVCRK